MASYEYVVSTGTITVDTSQTKTTVEEEFREIFGDDFITDDETPEGALINSEVSSRQGIARNNAQLANQINPNLSGGLFLDAIWALTNGQRQQATRSTVNCTLTGIPNTVVPAQSRARTTSGDEFRSQITVTIPTSSTLENVPFESVETGPIEAGSGTLTTIVDSILGWESITNPAAAVLGRETESDARSKTRRRNTLGLQGRAVTEAVSSNVAALPGVQSLAFRENTTDQTMTIDGIELVAHSVWANVNGGDPTEIAQALLRSKTVGANWNGAQEIDVTDQFSGQTYTVKFDRPDTVSMLVRVTARADSSLDDPSSIIRNSVLEYAAGEIDGEEGFIVGGDVSPFEISSAINRDNPSLFITKVEVSENLETPVYSTDTFEIGLDSIATINASGIFVVLE